MFQDYKKSLSLRVASVSTEEIKPITEIQLPEIDEKGCIEIEVEQLTLEDYIKYQEYKNARNERVKEKFKGGNER